LAEDYGIITVNSSSDDGGDGIEVDWSIFYDMY
jgi:hypothetical protein